MTGVRYYCPRCRAVAALERDGYLADKCVTPYPLDGWEYAAPHENFEDAEGVEIVCGGWETRRASQLSRDGERSADTEATDGEGCGEVYYLSFVKYEGGEEVEPRHPADFLPPSPSVRSASKSADDEDEDDGPRFDFEP